MAESSGNAPTDTATAQTGASGAEADGRNQPDNTKRSKARQSSSKRSSGSTKGSGSHSSSSGSKGVWEAIGAIVDHIGNAELSAAVHEHSGKKFGAPYPGSDEKGNRPDA